MLKAFNVGNSNLFNVSSLFFADGYKKRLVVSRHPISIVNLKSNTIMKKPRGKYKKEIKPRQIISIKNQKYFFLIKL